MSFTEPRLSPGLAFGTELMSSSVCNDKNTLRI